MGHSLMGVSIYLLFPSQNKRGPAISGWSLLGAVFLADLPDLDFLLGFLEGDPHLYHGKGTHSLIFAVATALLIGLLFRHDGDFRGLFFRSSLLIASHDVMDILSARKLGPYKGEGVALFYPFSEEMVASPFSVFYGVQHKDLEQLFSLVNFRHILYEILILGPVVAVLCYRRYKKSIQKGEG
ncbi:MAG: metal-dependent hydrolase [Nitrospirae bacterium]|nr:metal-dependent hydrolase [Nitrospirota bacterium]